MDLERELFIVAVSFRFSGFRKRDLNRLGVVSVPVSVRLWIFGLRVDYFSVGFLCCRLLWTLLSSAPFACTVSRSLLSVAQIGDVGNRLMH